MTLASAFSFCDDCDHTPSNEPRVFAGHGWVLSQSGMSLDSLAARGSVPSSSTETAVKLSTSAKIS